MDKRADIWAFGVVLYEMLTGRQAFHGETITDVLAAVVTKEPQWDRVPAKVRRLLQLCLQKDPKQRLQAIGDWRVALEEAPQAAERRSSRTVALVVSGACLLVAASVFVTRLWTPRAPSPSFQRVTFRRGVIDYGRFSSGGRGIIYSASWDGNPYRVYSTQAENPESWDLGIMDAHLLGVAPSDEMALTLTPGLVFGGVPGTLARAPISGGTPREVADDIAYADWTSDGKRLAVVRDQRLGVQVTIFTERLLAKEEPEVSALVQQILEREGVRIVPHRASAVAREDGGIGVVSAGGSIQSEMLFVAAGRQPVLDGLQLEAAGVKLSEKGIAVNDHLQTSTPTIYAAGDVLGRLQFSHFAGWQGYQAARNALLPGNNSGFSRIVPRITFSDPEVAQVGLLEHEARSKFRENLQVECWGLDRLDRAICENDLDGFIKVIAKNDGTILGATIVARRAGETIMELVTAMHQDIKIDKLAGLIHPYPSYSSAIQFMATEMAMQHAFGGLSGKLIRLASRFG